MTKDELQKARANEAIRLARINKSCSIFPMEEDMVFAIGTFAKLQETHWVPNPQDTAVEDLFERIPISWTSDSRSLVREVITDAVACGVRLGQVQ